MAASQWFLYNSFRRYMGDGTINLDSDTFRMALFTSAANVDNDTLSVLGSLINEVTSGNGYIRGGKTLAGVTWSTGASAGVMVFDCSATVWSASGGPIADVRYAVIYDESTGASAGDRKLVGHCALSAASFNFTAAFTVDSLEGVFSLN